MAQEGWDSRLVLRTGRIEVREGRNGSLPTRYRHAHLALLIASLSGRDARCRTNNEHGTSDPAVLVVLHIVDAT